MRKGKMILLLGLSIILYACSNDKIANETDNSKITVTETAVNPEDVGGNDDLEGDPSGDEVKEGDSSGEGLSGDDFEEDPGEEDMKNGDLNGDDLSGEAPGNNNSNKADNEGTEDSIIVTITPAVVDTEDIDTEASEDYHPATLPVEGQNNISIIKDYGEEEPTIEVPEGDEKNYPRRLDNGKEVSLDLNGDGAKESVYLDVVELSIKINGVEYGDKDGDGLLENYDIFPDSPSSYGYYITDIDKGDAYKEIAFIAKIEKFNSTPLLSGGVYFRTSSVYSFIHG